MDNKELLQSAKDEAAREWNFRDYEDMTDVTIPDDKFINRAMEIYAEKVNEESLKLLERASWLVGNPGTNISSSTDLACESWQNDYSQFKPTKP